MKKRITLVFGTRPEAIKLAPLIIELHSRSARFDVHCHVTGQHREMLDQVTRAFELNIESDFNLMRPEQSLPEISCRILERLSEHLEKERPDCLVIQGDTTTAFMSALAAYYNKIPIVHVEAGLRTGDRYFPYPEEMNRKLIGHLADYHFAPTTTAQDRLVSEGIDASRIWVTGNTVVDALRIMVDRVRASKPRMPPDFPDTLELAQKRMVLITGHRRENFGAGLESICRALCELAGKYNDYLWVYPVHLNPAVRKPVNQLLGGVSNIRLVDPMEYMPFTWAMDHCHLILTDSGGIQEEAPYLGKPVLVMRGETERPEAVAAGTAKLVGTETERIVHETSLLLDDTGLYSSMSRASNPYGNGTAARQIADILEEQSW